MLTYNVPQYCGSILSGLSTLEGRIGDIAPNDNDALSAIKTLKRVLRKPAAKTGRRNL